MKKNRVIDFKKLGAPSHGASPEEAERAAVA
jgi:hypothetical protein